MVDGVRNGFGVPGRRGRPRSWVYTAGTVARIDLRLPHHPRLGSPLLRYVRHTHIVAVLAIYRCSTMAQTGVSGPVVVDGESFLDALFASAGQG